MKIVAMRSLGEQQVFNLEMASRHHNYIIKPEIGQPVHKNSHSTSYIMQAYLTAWLKVYFPPEWWSSVMNRCHPDKRVKYMNVARSEEVQFSPINVEDISINFTVDVDTLAITPGLTSIKGVGQKATVKIVTQHKYDNIDEFVDVNGKSKTIMQRLILLGAFRRYHKNVKATWMWYQYKYCSGKDITALKKEINDKLLDKWTPELIKEHVERSVAAFKALHPKRKVPAKIINWKPKAEPTREKVMALYPDDYTLKELLDFEKLYLGYYWHSPMDMYNSIKGSSIILAKDGKSSSVCGVVEKIWIGQTKSKKPYGRVYISDGVNTATIMVWENELEEYRDLFDEKAGIRAYVDYDKNRDTLTLARRRNPISRLETKEEYNKRMVELGYDVVMDEDAIVEGVE